MKKNKLIGLLTASFVSSLMFSACGGDSKSPEKNDSKVPQVESYDDLVHCTKSHYGETVYVEDQDKYYECTSEDWKEISEEDIDVDDPKSSSSYTPSKGDTNTVEIQKVDAVTIKGYAEKGPYVKDAAVTVYGLDKSFNKTKTTFKGKVGAEKGAYTVEKVAFENQYAVVEVNGFFYSEISGKSTSGTKTKLNSLVDLSSGKTVNANVNVATELEMARALYLVQNEKYNVPAAKIRATKELLDVFDVTADSVSATELTLQGADDQTAALYAASIALMGKLSLSKFQNRLSSVSEEFAATGSFSDSLRVNLADYLSQVDSTDGYASILANVKNVNAKAPAFDKLLYTFWTSNYQLPACTEDNENTQEKNKNKLSSNYGAGYVCSGKHWHKSSKQDSEFGLCTSKIEGSYEKSETGDFYTCKNGQWREITKAQYELKECTDDIAKDDNKKYRTIDDKEYFLCKDNQWVELSAIEFVLKDCSAANKDDVMKVALDDNYYACLENGWTKVDDVIGINGFCTETRKNSFGKDVDGNIIICDGSEWRIALDLEARLGVCDEEGKNVFEKDASVTERTQYLAFTCNAGVWSEIECTKDNFQKILDNDVICGIRTKEGDEFFYWRDASFGERVTKKVCWTKDLNYGGASNAVVGDIQKGYVCQSTPREDGSGNTIGWRTETAYEKIAGVVCNSKINGNQIEPSRDSYPKAWVKNAAGDTVIVCVYGYPNGSSTRQHYWRAATEFDYEDGRLCGSFSPYLDNSYRHVCSNGAWRDADAGEIATHKICNSDYEGQVVQSVDPDVATSYYTCLNKGTTSSPDYTWRASTTAEIANKTVCNKTYYDNHSSTMPISNGYVCDKIGASYSWRTISAAEKATGIVCVADSLYRAKAGYICSKSGTGYAWSEGGRITDSLGYACNALTENQFSWVDEFPYRCVKDDDGYGFHEDQSYKYVKFQDQINYKVVEIGSQVWMAENMRSMVPNKSSCYENQANCSEDGTLWTLDGAKSICSGFNSSWHLPSNDEWEQLVTYVDEHGMGSSGSNVPSKSLRSKYGWESGESWDNFGFSARPAGYLNSVGKYQQKGYGAYFWTSSETGGYPYYRYTYSYYSSKMFRTTISSGTERFSVRCVCNKSDGCYK